MRDQGAEIMSNQNRYKTRQRNPRPSGAVSSFRLDVPRLRKLDAIAILGNKSRNEVIRELIDAAAIPDADQLATVQG